MRLHCGFASNAPFPPRSGFVQPFHRADSLRQRRLDLHFILGQACTACASRSCQTLGIGRKRPRRHAKNLKTKARRAPLACDSRSWQIKGVSPILLTRNSKGLLVVNKVKAVRLIIAAVIFGVLMSISSYFSDAWVRVLISACAGAVLGLILIDSQNRKP